MKSNSSFATPETATLWLPFILRIIYHYFAKDISKLVCQETLTKNAPIAT